MKTTLCIAILAFFSNGCGCGDEGQDDDSSPSDAGDDGGADAGPDAGNCGAVEVGQMAGGDGVGGEEDDAIAGAGDWVMESDRVALVVDDVGDPDHIAPTGGTLLELGIPGRAFDDLNQVSQLFTGRQGATIDYDAVATESDERSARIVVTGAVHDRPDFEARTTYELRTCEPFVRIVTEVTNGSDADPEIPASDLGPLVLDVLFWGTRSLRPFCPGQSGEGFACPPFDISDPVGSTGSYPFVAAYARSGPPFAMAIFSPTEGEVFGVDDEQISALGPPSGVAAAFAPGETKRYERWIAVSDARSDVAAAADLALGALDLETGTACLDVTLPPGAEGARIELFEPYGPDPDNLARRRPWTDLAPEASGQMEAAVPAGEYRVLVTPTSGPAVVGPAVTVPAAARSTCAAVDVPAPSTVSVEVVDPAGAGVPARLVVVGTGATPSPAFDPYGGSPAANQWLTDLDGTVDLALGPGTYDVWAVHGIRWTIARASIVVPDDGQVTLEIAPFGTLGAAMTAADLHVHSILSFDSSLPLDDRVTAYVAEGVDALVASEHDVIGDYGSAVDRLAVGDRIVAIAGLEATSNVPTEAYPHTIGHHNAWPLVPEPGARRNGAPVDEFLSVGELYAALRALPTSAGDTVVQFNHARSSQAGTIWLGWFDACGFDPLVPLAESDPCGVLGDDGGFDLMEIANGDSIVYARDMTTDWLSIVGQRGHVTGVANSDSHRLGEIAGFPTNLVDGAFDAATFDVASFDDTLKAGGVYGTSGPILRVEAVDDADLDRAGPGGTIAVDADDASLDYVVEAAPWIPVTECRFLVNGAIALTVGEFPTPDPFDAAADPVRQAGLLDLTNALAGVAGDAFLVVQCGEPWPSTDDEPVRTDPYSIVAPGHDPFGFSNPIYLDLDGGGWTPPGE